MALRITASRKSHDNKRANGPMSCFEDYGTAAPCVLPRVYCPVCNFGPLAYRCYAERRH